MSHVQPAQGNMTAGDLKYEFPVGFESLNPTAFLDRAMVVYGDRTAVVDGDERWSYAEFGDRCQRQAGMLAALGVKQGDRVGVLAPNGHLLLEAHYGVLYAGAVLVALNTRLAAEELRYIVDHAGCDLVIAGEEFEDLARAAAGPGTRVITAQTYEDLLHQSQPYRAVLRDERAMITLNYTSGTTGRPKGVMYHARGAYLQAIAMTVHWKLADHSVYLWTLPMFHCNGWCFTWAVTAVGGTHVCVPRPEPERVWQLIAAEGVTMLCAAPTVLTSLVHHPLATSVARPISAAVGGAPPTPALLQHCEALGLSVTQLYGMTETFGPIVICEWQPSWDHLSAPEQAGRRARQGLANLVTSSVRVVDPTGRDVVSDGQTIGEIAVRGNTVMLGYYQDPEATQLAVPDGWLRTGDLAVLHHDGYLEIRDRSKDVIISGGENISSVEVEAALASHPAVLEAAVVAKPDAKWGERPIAWVTLKAGATATPEELRRHVRTTLAAFKVPDEVVFDDLPKTASGKIRKVELRERVGRTATS
jgi:fatty-acyl-CoA synthase